MQVVSYQNITTKRILLEKTSLLAHLSRAGKKCRGLLRHVLNFMQAFLYCLSSQKYIAKSGAIDVIQRFIVKLNQISVDII